MPQWSEPLTPGVQRLCGGRIHTGPSVICYDLGLVCRWRSLTSVGRVGHVLVDGTEVVVLLAQLAGSKDVADALV